MEITEIVDTYADRVYNVALRISGNRIDADDITQETFLQVHRKLHSFRGESDLFTWMYRIAVNASLQVKRQANRAVVDSLDETVEEFQNDIPDDVRSWREDPETRYIYDELIAEVQRACFHFITYRLTDEQRVVYVMRVILGFSLDELAAILDVNKNAVKVRLHRAKQNLKRYFSGRCQWVPGGGDCSCESRLGFALVAAPEILQRLRDHPPDPETRTVIKNTVGDIDQLFRRVKVEEYKADAIKRMLA